MDNVGHYHVFAPSVKLSAKVAGRRFVTATGAPAGTGVNVLGVSYLGADSGEVCTVATLGTAMVTAGGAVAAGAAIQSDANGKAVTQQGNGKTVARALTASTAADQDILVHLIPN